MPFHPPIGVRYVAPRLQPSGPRVDVPCFVPGCNWGRPGGVQLSLEELDARARGREWPPGVVMQPTTIGVPSPFASPVVPIGLAVGGVLALWLLLRKT